MVDVELQPSAPPASASFSPAPHIHTLSSTAPSSSTSSLPAVAPLAASPLASPVPPVNAYSDSLPDVNVSAAYPVPFLVTGRRQFIANFRLLSVTTALSVVLTIILISELIVGAKKFSGAFVSSNPMGGPDVATLYYMGGKWEPSIRNDGQAWRLFSAPFLHSGLLHLALNLSALIITGYTFEARFRPLPFSLIFIATAVLGNLWSCVSYASSVGVGASGGLFGLVGADFTYLIYNWPLVENARWEFLILVLYSALGIGLGFLSIVAGNLDNFAHLGGLCSGIAMGMFILQLPAKRRAVKEWSWRVCGFLLFAGLYILFCLLLWVGNPNGPSDVSNF